MLFRDVVYFPTESTFTENNIGDTIEVLGTPRQVFANKKSIRQSEFYQAMAQGIRPSLTFEVREVEYTGEQNLDYEGKTYQVIRTFSKNGEILELICQGLSADG